MYCPAPFAVEQLPDLHRLIGSTPLATLVRDGPDGLTADHLPLLLATDAGAPLGVLRGHVARANTLWRGLRADSTCLVLFAGPAAYVSPSWYPSKALTHKAVPTYNYSVVHARGRLRAIDDPGWLRSQVGELTRHFEAHRRTPWQPDDAPTDYIDAMLRGIVGIEVEITQLTGKRKLSQNRSDADRAGVIAGLRAEADANAHGVADAMDGLLRQPQPAP